MSAQAQTHLYLPSFETFGAQRRPHWRGVTFPPFLALSRASHAVEAERHTVFFLGERPLIDITDGYFNMMQWLSMSRYLTAYFWVLRSLRGIDNLSTLLGDKVVDCRRIGKHVAFWYHPYLLIAYARAMEAKLSPLVSRDKQFILSGYQVCIEAGGADYLNEFDHFCVDHHGLYIDWRDLWQLHCTFSAESMDVSKTRERGFVYLIQVDKQRMFKIGVSNDPEARLKTLQAANHARLRLIHAWAVAYPYQIECALHTLFAAALHHGEWFALSTVQEAELIIYMEQYKDGQPPLDLVR